MSQAQAKAIDTARDYYNSKDADNFYFHIWGGEDIHIGLYNGPDDNDIAAASRRTVSHMADRLGDLPEGARVLDMGSGYGGAARQLVHRFRCRVTALNLSETENARNRQKNRETGLADHIEVVDGNFESVPCGDGQFDVVWSQDAILHSPNREKVMAEARRVLKPGGALIFTDPMQADQVPDGVLDPVLERIHLQSLGSFAFYRSILEGLGMHEAGIEKMTHQLVNHYSAVRRTLLAQRSRLSGKVSESYIERMLSGLQHWVDAGLAGYLAWGVVHFTKPE